MKGWILPALILGLIPAGGHGSEAACRHLLAEGVLSVRQCTREKGVRIISLRINRPNDSIEVIARFDPGLNRNLFTKIRAVSPRAILTAGDQMNLGGFLGIRSRTILGAQAYALLKFLAGFAPKNFDLRNIDLTDVRIPKPQLSGFKLLCRKIGRCGEGCGPPPTDL